MDTQTSEETTVENFIIRCHNCGARYSIPKAKAFWYQCNKCTFYNYRLGGNCFYRLGGNCFSCSSDLKGKPKILIEEKVFCFSCAKKQVPAIKQQNIELATNKYKKLKEEYELKVQAHDHAKRAWNNKKENALSGNPFGLCFGIPFVVVAAIITGPFALLSLIVALCVWAKLHSSKEKELFSIFLANNPEPILKEKPPENEVVEDIRHELLPPDGSVITDKWYQREIIERDGGICQACGKPTEKLEVHHILPRAQGGKDDPTNLITLCCYCHDRENWYGHIRAYPTTITKEAPPAQLSVNGNKKYRTYRRRRNIYWLI